MCLTFKKNNKQTKKPVNRFLQDDASAGIRSLQTSIEIKLFQNPWNGLQRVFKIPLALLAFAITFKDVQGWQFLTMKAVETLCV